MTSPAHNPAAFHFRPAAGELALPVPPARHVIYRCAICRREFAAWRNRCLCHPAALLHGCEVDAPTYQKILRNA